MSFYTDVIMKDPRFSSIRPCNDVMLLEPSTRVAVAKLLVMANAAGHDLQIGETFRSQARQTQVFRQGASKLSKVGCHGYGLAVDFKLLVNGKYDPKGEDYAFLEGLCRQVGLIPGADWGQPKIAHSFRDWDHVQRVPIFRQNDLFAGRWYPPADYDPYADMKAHAIPGIA